MRTRGGPALLVPLITDLPDSTVTETSISETVTLALASAWMRVSGAKGMVGEHVSEGSRSKGRRSSGPDG